MTPEQKEKAKEANRKWYAKRKNDPEFLAIRAERSRVRYASNPEKHREQSKNWKKNNREKVNKYKKEYLLVNPPDPEKVKERRKRYESRHKEEIKQRKRQQRIANQAVIVAYKELMATDTGDER